MDKGKKKKKTTKKKADKKSNIDILAGGGNLSKELELERKKLIYVYRNIMYYPQKKIARTLKIHINTVKKTLKYWRETDDVPLDKLHNAETLRLAQIYKQRLIIEELYVRKRKLERGYIEGKETTLTGFTAKGPVETTSTTTCKKFHEGQISVTWKQIQEAEKEMSVLLGVRVEKSETDHTFKTLDQLMAQAREDEEG